jgi:hypothetical protein
MYDLEAALFKHTHFVGILELLQNHVLHIFSVPAERSNIASSVILRIGSRLDANPAGMQLHRATGAIDAFFSIWRP